MKNALIITGKFLIAAAIIAFMVTQGQIDFTLLQQIWDYKLVWFFSALCIITQPILATARWKKILEIKTKDTLSFYDVGKIAWVGLAYDSVLPGAVSGDILKVFYAQRLNPKLNKTFLLSSVLVDRIFGLLGLILVAGVSSMLFYTDIIDFAPKIKPLLEFNFLLLFAVVVFLASIFLHRRLQDLIHQVIQKIPYIGNFLSNLLEQVWLIGKNKLQVLYCLGLSISSHLVFIFGLHLIATPFYTVDVPTQYMFTFFPIGFISMAIPITPAGLGVGHTVFGLLFNLVGVSNGASLFNLFILTALPLYMLGFLVSLFGMKSLSDKQVYPSSLE